MKATILFVLIFLAFAGIIGISRFRGFPKDDSLPMKRVFQIAIVGNVVAIASFVNLFDRGLAGKDLRPMLETLPMGFAVVICSLLIFSRRKQYSNSGRKPFYLVLGFLAGLSPFLTGAAALKLASLYSGFTIAD